MGCKVFTAFVVVVCTAHLVRAATLSGTVVDEEGKPIASAAVDICTAAPMVGLGIFCPSCYLDCRKRATTDTEGRFEINDLSDDLRFRVLFAAVDKKTHLTELVNPQSETLTIQLAPAPDAPDERKIGGIVVDNAGFPIEGVILSAVGAKRNDRRWWGRVDVSSVVSDRTGHFEFVLPDDLMGIDISVQADGFAGTRTTLISVGTRDMRIEVPLGATISGRLTRGRQAGANQMVAVVQIDRDMETNFIKAVARTTDGDGRFTISNLPASQGYVVFSPVGEIRNLSRKVIVTKQIKAPKDGQELDLGELELHDGLSLSGRIVLPQGESLPPGLKISLGRNPAWDLIEISPGSDGSFTIDGLPPESYEVRLATRECEIDGSRLKNQRLEKNSFGINLARSCKDLIVPICLAPSAVERPEGMGVDLDAGSQTLIGIVVDTAGEPTPGITVSAKLANSYHHLSAKPGHPRPWTVTDSEGQFKINGLPNVPIQLLVYKRLPQGGRIPFPAKAWPAMNSNDVRIIYDLELLR